MAPDRHVTLMLPVFEFPVPEHVLALATMLARAWRATVVLLNVVEVAEEPLSGGVLSAQRRRETLHQIQAPPEVHLRTQVRVSRSINQGIRDAVLEAQPDLLVLGWDAQAASPERVFGAAIEQLLAAPPCDVLVVKYNPDRPVRRILLPTTGGPNLQLCSTVAGTLAAAADGGVTILFAHDRQRQVDAATLKRIRALQELPFVDQYLEAATPALPVILAEAEAHDAVVIGASGRRFNPNLPVGPLGTAVLKESSSTVVIVLRKLNVREQRAVAQFEAERDISTRVDGWFAENTFSGDEFADVDQLVALKRQQGLTISLALPALNEAATVGPLIDALKAPLFDAVPLIDEIALIDSNSTDDTRAIARSLNIPVHIHQEVLPQYGSFAGKGEALWKSLYLVRGDIVVWLDTDIHDIHPRFVYGLVGPLLREPRLQFTKGFYRRPIKVEGKMLDAGGGRVTELVARPLFNLFFPELSGFIQPLSGEYAGRRVVLEQLPFFTGYGVETGLLIDLLLKVGLRGMAQVDLQQRVHRNQDLHGLSRMAFAITQVVMSRLEQRQRLRLIDPLNQSLKLIQYADGGGFHLDVREIRDHERPPICTIPEYAAERACVSI